MAKLDLTRAAAIKGPWGEALAMKGAGWSWTRPVITPHPLAAYYGVGEGKISTHLDSSNTVLNDDGFAIRVRNTGGAGSMYDLTSHAITPVPVADGALQFSPTLAMFFNGVPREHAPDVMGTRVMIVADVVQGSNSYFMGNGSPQTNVYLHASGERLFVNRRNSDTNSWENTMLPLTSPPPSGRVLHELEFIPAERGGTIRYYANGRLLGETAHSFPNLQITNFAAGQNPANGASLNGRVWDVIALSMGAEYDAAVEDVRGYLVDKHDLTLWEEPEPDPNGHPLAQYHRSGAIPIHFTSSDVIRDSAVLSGFRNIGAAGELFDAVVAGGVDVDGDWITTTTRGSKITLPRPAELQGVRLFMVTRGLLTTNNPSICGHPEPNADGAYGLNNPGNTALRLRQDIGAIVVRKRTATAWTGPDITIGADWTGLTLLEVALHPTEIRTRAGGDTDVVHTLSLAHRNAFDAFQLSEIAAGGMLASATGDYGDVISVVIDHPDYAATCEAVRAYLRTKYEVSA